MKFSFILPAWKDRYLRESIASILSQTYRDLELVVVDDCSPDSIRQIVESFHDERLSYHRNEQNIGGGNLVAQWNHCLTFARGEYVILATDDDIYCIDFLDSIRVLIEKYPETLVFRTRIMSVNSNGEMLWPDRSYKEFLTQGEFLYTYLQGIKGGIPQFVFNRKALISSGGFVGFPLAWGSDDATALKLSGHGVVNTQEMLVKFRWSDINISSNFSKSVKREKNLARAELCLWLIEYIKTVEFEDSEIEKFYKKNIIGNFNIYIKNILIKEIRILSVVDMMRQIMVISSLNILNKKDLLSILYRYFSR